MNSIEFLKKIFYHLFIYELMNHHSRIISSTINFYNFRVKFNDIHPIMNRLIWFVISNVRKWFSFNGSITIKERKLTSGTKPLTNYFEKKVSSEATILLRRNQGLAVVKLHLCGDFDNRQSAEAVPSKPLKRILVVHC